MNQYVEDLIKRYPDLAPCADAVADACDAVIGCYEKGGKLLLCGNGGSCADCGHIAGELLKGFRKKRPIPAAERAEMTARRPGLDSRTLDLLQKGLPAIPLTEFAAAGTAFCNDVDPDLVYAQLTLALGRPGDAIICISTSGNAKNVAAAAEVAGSMGITVIGLTGEGGGALRALSDVLICVPGTETFKIQERHLPVYHCICAAVEGRFFRE